MRRSRNFVTRLGLGVDVLTLDYRLDVSEARARLRASGELIDGMELRNAWAEVASFDRRQPQSFGGTATGAGIPHRTGLPGDALLPAVCRVPRRGRTGRPRRSPPRRRIRVRRRRPHR
ncbi:hypothetical protein IOD13_12735 [Brevibacterium casei]|nr:hypothetical protein [Brevibacterium casei]